MQPSVIKQSPASTFIDTLEHVVKLPSSEEEGDSMPPLISSAKHSRFLIIDLSGNGRDPLFRFLLKDSWIDSKANPTERLKKDDTLSVVMKKAMPKIKENMSAFFSERGKYHFRDGREISSSHAMMFQYIHACANGTIPYLQLVGGGVRFFLGEDFFIKPIESLGGVFSPELLDQIKDECRRYPHDFDFRFQIHGMRGKQFKERAALVQAMTSAATYFLGQTLFLSDPASSSIIEKKQPFPLMIPIEYMQNVHASAYRKYNYIDPKKAQAASHFGIISIDFSDTRGRKSALEALFIDQLARNHLFGVDDVRLSVPFPFVFSKDKSNVVWLNDSGTLWVPILHRVLRVVGDDKPETINHKGFPLIISHITRGYRCLDEKFLRTVFTTFQKYQPWGENPFLLAEEISQVLSEHHKEEQATILPFTFNLLMHFKMLGELEGTKTVSAVVANSAKSAGLTHPSIPFLISLKEDSLAFDRFSALFTLYYHVQEALGVASETRVQLKENVNGSALYVPDEQEGKRRYFVAPYSHRSMLNLLEQKQEKGASLPAIDDWLFRLADASGFFSMPTGSTNLSDISALAEELALVDCSFFKAASCYLRLLASSKEGEGLTLLKIALDIFSEPVHPVFFEWFNQTGIHILLKKFPESCSFKALFSSHTGPGLIKEVACYLCKQPGEEAADLGLQLLKKFAIEPTLEIVNSLLDYHLEMAVSLICKREDLPLKEWGEPLAAAAHKVLERGFLVQDLPLSIRLLAPIKNILSLSGNRVLEEAVPLTRFLHGFIPRAIESGMEDAAFEAALELEKEISALKTGYSPAVIRLFNWGIERRDERVFALWNYGLENAFEGSAAIEALAVLEKMAAYLMKEGRMPEVKSLLKRIPEKVKFDPDSTLMSVLKGMMEESLNLGEIGQAESLISRFDDLEHLSFKGRLLLTKYRGSLLKQDAFLDLKALAKQLHDFKDKTEMLPFVLSLMTDLLQEAIPLKSLLPKRGVPISAYFLDSDLLRIFYLSEHACFDAALKLHESCPLYQAIHPEVMRVVEAVFPLACKQRVALSEPSKRFILSPALAMIKNLTMRDVISPTPFIIQLKDNAQKIIFELASDLPTLEAAVDILAALKTLNLAEVNSKEFVNGFFEVLPDVDYRNYPSKVRAALKREIHWMLKKKSRRALILATKIVSDAIQDGKKEETLGLLESWHAAKAEIHGVVTNRGELLNWMIALVQWNLLDKAEIILKILSEEHKKKFREPWLNGIASVLQEKGSSDPVFSCRLLLVLSKDKLLRNERTSFLRWAAMAAEDLLASDLERKSASLAFDVIGAYGLYSRQWGEGVILKVALMDDQRMRELALDLYLELRSRQKRNYPFNEKFCLTVLKLFLSSGKRAAPERINEFVHDFEQFFSHGIPQKLNEAAFDFISLLIKASESKKTEFLLKAYSYFETSSNCSDVSGDRLLSCLEPLVSALMEEGSDLLFEKAVSITLKTVNHPGGQEGRKNGIVQGLIKSLLKRPKAEQRVIESIILSLKARFEAKQPLSSFSQLLESACDNNSLFAESFSVLIPKLLSNQLPGGESKVVIRLIKTLMGSLAKNGRWKALGPLRRSPEVNAHFKKELQHLEAGNFALYLQSSIKCGIKAKDLFFEIYEEASIFRESQNPEALFRELAVLWTTILDEGGNDGQFVSSMYCFILSLSKDYYENKSAFKSPMVVHVAVDNNPAVPLFYMQPPKGLAQEQVSLFTNCYEKLLQQISKRLIEVLGDKEAGKKKQICLEAFAGAIYSYINMLPDKKRDICKCIGDYLSLIGEIDGKFYTQFLNVANTIMEAGTIASTFSASEETLYRLVLFVSPSTRFQPLHPRIYHEAVMDIASGLIRMQGGSSSGVATTIIHHHFPNLIHYAPKKAKTLFCQYVDKIVGAPFYVNDGSYVLQRTAQAAVELFRPSITPHNKTAEESSAILDCQLHLAKSLIQRAQKPELFLNDERAFLITCLKSHLEFMKGCFTAEERRKELMGLIKPATEVLMRLASKDEANHDLLWAIAYLCDGAFPERKQNIKKHEERGVQPIASAIQTFLTGLIDTNRGILPHAYNFTTMLAGRHSLLDVLGEAVKKHAEGI